jgi:hypothetical protein
LLVTAEQGEDAVKAVYADALDRELPLPLRQLLTAQQSQVLLCHDYAKSHRDELATK